MNRFDDNYYRKWPFPVTDEEVAAEGYLKSLTAPEELAGSWGHGVMGSWGHHGANNRDTPELTPEPGFVGV